MGKIRVISADTSGGRITGINVQIDRLPNRSVDRDTAIRWLRDGHSLLFGVGGHETALQLVEVGEDAVAFVRIDNEPIAEDRVV